METENLEGGSCNNPTDGTIISIDLIEKIEI
jgi:hypothetical protein